MVRSMSLTTRKTPKELKPPRMPRYTPQNQQILDETMIPGPCLRFFKTKKEKKRLDNANLVTYYTLFIFEYFIKTHSCI